MLPSARKSRLSQTGRKRWPIWAAGDFLQSDKRTYVNFPECEFKRLVSGADSERARAQLAGPLPEEMTKRKKENSAAARSTRGGHLLGPPRAANGAARAAESNSTPAGPAVKRRPASPKQEPVTAPVTTLALAAECTVADAASLKESLTALLDEPLAVTLDVTALQRIDTAGLQVISAFVLERSGHGRPVEWRGTAPALTNAAQLLGLTSLLGLPA